MYDSSLTLTDFDPELDEAIRQEAHTRRITPS